MKNLTLQLITAAVLSIGGLILLFCGTFIQPEGEIDESLLIGFGEVATFAGSLFGIDYHYRQKYINHENNPTDSQEPTGQSRLREPLPPNEKP